MQEMLTLDVVLDVVVHSLLRHMGACGVSEVFRFSCLNTVTHLMSCTLPDVAARLGTHMRMKLLCLSADVCAVPACDYASVYE